MASASAKVAAIGLSVVTPRTPAATAASTASLM